MKIKHLGLTLLMSISLSSLMAQTISKTIFVPKAGTLKEQITQEEASTITNLTLTGKINAKDFKLMRDSLAKLEVLDLSNVSIANYMGKEGTYPDKFYIYPMKCIPAYAFCNGDKGLDKGKQTLKQVILPTTTYNIEDCAFLNCNQLTTVLINKKSPPNLMKKALNDSITSVFIPVGCRDEYKKKKNWEQFAILEGTPITQTISVIKAGELGNEIMNAGLQPKELNYLTIRGNLNEADFKVIRDFMPQLVSLDLYATSATEIPDFTFAQKRFLMSITLPQGLTTIGERAFSGCSHLSGELLLPPTIKTIKDGAFLDCDRISKVVVQGDKLSVLGKNVFRDSSKQKVEFRK